MTYIYHICVKMCEIDAGKRAPLFDRKMKRCFIGSSGFCLLMIVVEVILLFTMPAERADSAANEKFCIGTDNCGEMADILHSYLDENINERFDILQNDEENRREHKANTTSYIALKSFLTTSYWQMIPAARVIGDIYKSGNEICGEYILCMGDLQPILHWTHTGRVRDNSVFLRHGMKYRDGRLVVPVSGNYYVYSYLDIHVPVNNSVDDNGHVLVTYTTGYPIIKHAVYKFNIVDEKEEELMTRNHMYQAAGGSDFDSVYNSRLESVVPLNAGDELMVKVSNVSFLSRPWTNYFGVNMV